MPTVARISRRGGRRLGSQSLFDKSIFVGHRYPDDTLLMPTACHAPVLSPQAWAPPNS
jgi:hypothetical protein